MSYQRTCAVFVCHHSALKLEDALRSIWAKSVRILMPYLAQKWVQRVLQLHGDALQSLAGALRAQKLQSQGLVLAIHLSGRQLCAGHT